MQSAKRLIDFDPTGIGQLLAADRLMVPLNQREYSWEEDHVNDLINDFSEAMDSPSGIHFLGSIFLTSGESEYPEITDGQQRLATTTMILAAFRDYLLRCGKHDDATSVERDFLFKWDRSEGENLPRLTLNADDSSFFHDTILVRPEDRKSSKKPAKPKESHKKIATAAAAVRKYIDARLAPERDDRKVRIINDWVKFIEKNALVVAITVPKDLDSYAMFETLNDRGLETSQADLLKNHLFSKVRDRMREAQQKWSNMAGKLESLGRKNITVTFIRHLLITLYGHTRQRDVLKTIKKEITKPSQAIKFLDAMSDSADDYVAMLNPSHEKWGAYGDETREHLRVIHLDLEVSQVWPLLFAVTKHFPIPQARKAFKYLLNLSVRFLIVGGRGGLLDTNYARVSQEVGSGNIRTAKALADSLDNIAPSDEAFEAEFANARVSEANLARYYLRALEKSRNQLPSPEVMPIEDRNKLNLEHVLPENPGSGWPAFTPDDAKAFYRRIGNLVLMLSTQNSALGNSSFAVKKPILLASGLTFTKMAGKATNWTKDEIVKRQKELAKEAVKTWPLTVT